jgi:transcriptional regulator with XRE-family HTH domain
MEHKCVPWPSPPRKSGSLRNIVKPIILLGSSSTIRDGGLSRSGAGRIMKKPKKTKGSTDAVGLLYRRHIEGKPEIESILDEERGKAEVARLVYEARTQAGLTQKELADRIGTTPSVISRLEDADYGGHSLSMLRRIAAAVGQRVQIRFVASEPAGPRRVASRRGADRLPDPLIPAQEICAPIDLPRPGKVVRCEFREALHGVPDPCIPLSE